MRILFTLLAVLVGWIPSLFFALLEMVKIWGCLIMVAWHNGNVKTEGLRR